ncbi:MAG: ATP-binding protein [Solirubrobacterales bacterium]|nr:ATP-binding protein [Solirubrobacterales bacterium]
MTAEHYLGLTGARTMPTTALQLTQRAINDLVELQAMGVVYGPAGSGKTFAWQTAVDTVDVPVCAVQFPSRPSMLRVAQVLLGRLSGRIPKGSRFALSDELLDLLSERPRLVVVDEAQWLNRDCIEYVRHLHDDPATKFALLLVGGNGCWEVLEREAMLRSRLFRRVAFAPMSADAVLRVIPNYHQLYTGVDPELLLLIDDVFAHGYFREWATFTHTAQHVCEDRDTPLDEAITRAVFALHDGGADAGR